MALETVKDFDFGVGANIMLTQRVSHSPSDVSKTEVDFIVWLMLEQQFLKAKKRREIQQQRIISSRTQSDGLDDGVDEDDGDEIDLPRLSARSENPNDEKLRIAREYAEETLRGIGQDNMLWQDLSDKYREQMLIQLCKNSELFQGSTSIRSVPDMFARLRSSKFRSKFNVKKHLAKSGFGEVFLVTREGDLSNKPYAMKRITPFECESLLDDVKAACNESKILKILKGHQNIVKVYDYWLEIEPNSENSYISSNSQDDYEDGPLKFYIQLEYCRLSLETWKENNYKIGQAPEKSQVLSMALQIFDGLSHIHKKNILHLDISPKNILWKDSTCTLLKIVDFGLARLALSHNTKDGTVGYIAPEAELTQKSDVYSASVTIIEVAKTIYTKLELSQVIQGKIIDTELPDLNELLSLALNEDPGERPYAATIVESLAHLSVK